MANAGTVPSLMLASQFDEEFKAWLADGTTTTVLYIVVVLAVVGIILKATS